METIFGYSFKKCFVESVENPVESVKNRLAWLFPFTFSS